AESPTVRPDVTPVTDPYGAQIQLPPTSVGLTASVDAGFRAVVRDPADRGLALPVPGRGGGDGAPAHAGGPAAGWRPLRGGLARIPGAVDAPWRSPGRAPGRAGSVGRPAVLRGLVAGGN